MEFGVAGVAAITVICYLLGLTVKVSGLAATGMDQVKKQLRKS